MVHAEQTNAFVMVVLSTTLAGSGSALSGSLSRILFHEYSLGIALFGMEHPSHALHSPLQTPRTAQQAPRRNQLVFCIATDERSVGAATAVGGSSVICVADTSYT
ncbi:unnamed protein product, partial [Ectocarpus sp. 8 AP-2014]